jgi:RNA polymerase sigma factor (TIGR02999 family)
MLDELSLRDSSPGNVINDYLERTAMLTPPAHDITRLLADWRNGDQAALEQLTPLVYQELHKLARSYLRGERPGHTLQPTALIHEAYLRLVDQNITEWQSRTHFFGVAARLMRQILVEYARSYRAGKRGCGAPKLALDEALNYSQETAAELVMLDDALITLAAFDQRKARVIELRYFGGLTVEETAEVLGLSIPTVVRDQRMAQAWLHREMSKD